MGIELAVMALNLLESPLGCFVFAIFALILPIILDFALFFCFVLIWVSLYCRQAIQLRHYLPKVVSALPAACAYKYARTLRESATVVLSCRCMATYPYTSPSISKCTTGIS